MFLNLFKYFKKTIVQDDSLLFMSASHVHKQLVDDNNGLLDHNDPELRNAMWLNLRAALRGDKDAQYTMGLSYLNGQLGLDRSYVHAEKWLDQAAHHGHPNAIKELQAAYNQLAF